MVAGSVPGLAAFYGWLAAGGAAEELPPEARAALAGADEAFAAHRLPRPFAPLLSIGPLAVATALEADEALITCGFLPDPVGGWPGRAVLELRLAMRAEARGSAAARGEPGGPPLPGQVRPADLGTDGSPPRSLEHLVRGLTRRRDLRARLAPWLADLSGPLQRALYAAGRATRLDGRAGVGFALLLRARAKPLRCMLTGGWSRLDPRVVLGGALDTPALAGLAGTYTYTVRTARHMARSRGTGSPETDAASRAALELALRTAEPGSPARALCLVARIDDAILSHDPAFGEPLAELVADAPSLEPRLRLRLLASTALLLDDLVLNVPSLEVATALADGLETCARGALRSQLTTDDWDDALRSSANIRRRAAARAGS